jgi:hypothetical protein
METEKAGAMPVSAFSVKRHSYNKRLVLGTSVILVLTVCIFFPEAVSLRWHLTHGNFVTFHEWDVPIPWGWSSFTTDDTLVVQKMHRFGFRSGAFSQVMVAPLAFPANYKLEPEQWQKITIETQLKRGFRFVSMSRIRLDGKDGSCFSFAALQETERRLITCDFPDLNLSIGFIGDQSYAPTLDSIVKRINRRG